MSGAAAVEVTGLSRGRRWTRFCGAGAAGSLSLWRMVGMFEELEKREVESELG